MQIYQYRTKTCI